MVNPKAVPYTHVTFCRIGLNGCGLWEGHRWHTRLCGRGHIRCPGTALSRTRALPLPLPLALGGGGGSADGLDVRLRKVSLLAGLVLAFTPAVSVIPFYHLKLLPLHDLQLVFTLSLGEGRGERKEGGREGGGEEGGGEEGGGEEGGGEEGGEEEKCRREGKDGKEKDVLIWKREGRREGGEEGGREGREGGREGREGGEERGRGRGGSGGEGGEEGGGKEG